MTMMVFGQASSGVETLANVMQRAQGLLTTRWFPLTVNFAALLLLAWGLSSWTWVLFKPVVPVVIPDSNGAAPVNVVRFDSQALLSAHLFGQAPVAVGTQSINDIPISSLNLVLAGVVAAGGQSYALISVNGQAQEPFAVGQEIPTTGATLQAVYPDRAILTRNGVSESLMLEGMAKALSDVTGGGGLPTPAPSLGVQQPGHNQYMLPRDLITEQLRKPQELFSQALMVPNAGGGFLVREIQPNSLYEKLGLRVGDVLRSVNGKPINTVDDAMKVYQAVSNARNIQVEVIRGGRSEQLTYNLQ
jgi:general secretion pathway protein C